MADQKMTKTEAVRRALAALGKDTKPGEIQFFVKEMFGIEMSIAHISTAKSATLHKLKLGGKKRTVVPVSSAAPAPRSPVTVFEAVRTSLAELGKDAKTIALQAFIKERFALDVGTARIRMFKREILSQD
jgi:hypothetical protein